LIEPSWRTGNYCKGLRPLNLNAFGRYVAEELAGAKQTSSLLLQSKPLYLHQAANCGGYGLGLGFTRFREQTLFHTI
jgi:hypothetical protein